MILNKVNLLKINTSVLVQTPDQRLFDLPEKVLQFGTGVLLRGLPEYFIDKANKAGVFNGRVVVVKSTDRGTTNDFDQQDCLYTIAVRGLENGIKTEENIVCSAISRVINAQIAWNEILTVARSEDLEVIISNTTEAGIQLREDDVTAYPPQSFPGKLLAVLYERYNYFEGDKGRGLVIVPTELVSDNGKVLKDVVIKLAKQNNLEEGFLLWIERSNTFCNSLVDRIVPGKPDEDVRAALQEELGYSDELLIIAEVYRLWAIEGDDEVRQVLSFVQTDPGIVVTPDISVFRELKLRLLNGSHTLSCGAAILAEFETVYDAMEDVCFSDFVLKMHQEDFFWSIPYPVGLKEIRQFSEDVLDRFRNPYIKHYWLNITVNYTLKLKMRVIPMVLRYYQDFEAVPRHIAFGFAAYLMFMRSHELDGDFYGTSHGKTYKIDDEHAAYYHNLWLAANPEEVVEKALSNVQLWDTDLSILPGFAASVKEHTLAIERKGVAEAMKELNPKKIHFNETE